jgi:hypothetical protein
MRALGSLGAVLAALMISAAPAAANASLTSFGQTAHWSGELSNTAAPTGDFCSDANCQSYLLDLRLPAGTFDEPGGLLVALRWPETQLDLGYDLDLWVYGPDGKLAAKSDMVAYSAAEGAWVQDPKNGTYRIVISGRPEVGGSPYEVFADLKRGYTVHSTNTNAASDPSGAGALPFTPDLVFVGSRPAAPEPRLPDLVPDRPKNFHMETAIGATFYQSFDRGVRHPPSCYPQETTGADNDTDPRQQAGALRCLRFDQGLMNLGRGPFEIRAYPNNGDGTEAYQAVYRSDGSYSEKRVGMAKFSNAHGHIHFMGFDHTGLFTINPDGSPGHEVAHMVDKGRCAVDTHDPSFGKPANGPAHYYVPSTCDQNDNQDPRDPVYPNASYFRSGISPGWEDTYPWFIPDQYIDVTNVPDGRYLVINRVNVSGLVAEADTANDTSEACVDFHATTVTECPVVAANATAPAAAPKARHAKRRHRTRHHRRRAHQRHHRRGRR